jgi:hypothetical protein
MRTVLPDSPLNQAEAKYVLDGEITVLEISLIPCKPTSPAHNTCPEKLPAYFCVAVLYTAAPKIPVQSLAGLIVDVDVDRLGAPVHAKEKSSEFALPPEKKLLRYVPSARRRLSHHTSPLPAEAPP